MNKTMNTIENLFCAGYLAFAVIAGCIFASRGDEQLSLFPEQNTDTRPPMTTMWNLWHGCTKVSAGCAHCYMYRRDESVGRDPSRVTKTRSFNLPVRRLRTGEYKIPSGSHLYTCFSSDFFHADADGWWHRIPYPPLRAT